MHGFFTELFHTDEQVAAVVMEAFGYDKESNADEWRTLIDQDAARRWLTACDAAEDRLQSWRMSSRVYHLALARSKAARAAAEERATAQGCLPSGYAWMQRVKSDPESRLRFERAHRLYELQRIRWEQSNEADAEARRLSRLVFSAAPVEPKPTRPEPKDPEAMMAYWLRKIYHAEYLLGRARGRLEKAETAANRGDGREALGETFHHGLVGGSGGKTLRALNKRKEQAYDRFLKDRAELKAAGERVAMLEARVARFTGHYQMWEATAVAAKTL